MSSIMGATQDVVRRLQSVRDDLKISVPAVSVIFWLMSMGEAAGAVNLYRATFSM
jgi:hypothetical protein